MDKFLLIEYSDSTWYIPNRFTVILITDELKEKLNFLTDIKINNSDLSFLATPVNDIFLLNPDSLISEEYVGLYENIHNVLSDIWENKKSRFVIFEETNLLNVSNFEYIMDNDTYYLVLIEGVGLFFYFSNNNDFKTDIVAIEILN